MVYVSNFRVINAKTAVNQVFIGVFVGFDVSLRVAKRVNHYKNLCVLINSVFNFISYCLVFITEIRSEKDQRSKVVGAMGVGRSVVFVCTTADSAVIFVDFSVISDNKVVLFHFVDEQALIY